MSSHETNRKKFAVLLFLVEIVVIVMYGLFLRPRVHSDTSNNINYYPMYQDVNVMMLIGFGFLMTVIKNHSWSALSYTFFINAVIVQLYILLEPFWLKVFYGHWSDKIEIIEKDFIAASYSVASVLISFGAVLGRVGPLELLIMALVQIVGYSLNNVIVYEIIDTFDIGGSTAIHTFGAYFGLTVSLIIGKKVAPKTKPQSSYSSNIFSMIGTLFLWMFWPSFNAGFFPTTAYERSLIIINTIIALTGSCLGSFIMTAVVREKFSMEDILNASLAGGVIIGAPSGIFSNPAGALCVGLFGGVVSTLGFRYLSQKLEDWIGLNDSCGVHNLYGIPGILGGIFSAIAIASYTADPLVDTNQTAYLPFYPVAGSNLNKHGRTFYTQGGIQIAAIFISMGIAIVFGVLAGFLMRCFYVFNPQEFFQDHIYFEGVPESEGHNKLDLNDTVEMKKIGTQQKIVTK